MNLATATGASAAQRNKHAETGMASALVSDVVFERLAPLVVAWASGAAARPLDWGIVELLVLGVLAQIGLEFYRNGVPKAFSGWEQLAARGKPLEVFAARDLQFVLCSQVAIVLMMFHYLQYMATSENVVWRLDQLSAANTCVALPLFFLVYDAFYAPFHRALHHRSVYAFVHKHHHRQVVPTRGNNDAINVHPFEFLCGEYNHVLSLHLVARYLVQVHAVTAIAFLVIGGTLATLNHTRLDVSWGRIPGTDVPIFGVRAHDTHHVVPDSNYGQYTMIVDLLMGTFRAHPLDDGAAPGGASKGDARKDKVG